jgi:hypothetical protein
MKRRGLVDGRGLMVDGALVTKLGFEWFGATGLQGILLRLLAPAGQASTRECSSPSSIIKC